MNKQKTKFVILGLLSIKPLSGYDVKKLVNENISHFWAESNGQLYPTLNQLLKENLIILDQKHQNGKKISNIYSITQEGLTTLKKWLGETTEKKSTHRDEELLKLFFGKNSSPQVSIELLKKRQERVQKKLDQYIAIQKEIATYKSSPHYTYWNLSLKNGICHAEAELRWCSDSIKTLSP